MCFKTSSSSIASTSRVTVLWSDKYNPVRGLQPFDPSQYDGLVAFLNKFNEGEVDALGIAYAIIEALFNSELSYNSKWDVDGASCSKVTSEGSDPAADFPVSCQCHQQATYNHKDIYSVAEAKAKIVVLSRSEIHIVLYSYYVSG